MKYFILRKPGKEKYLHGDANGKPTGKYWKPNGSGFTNLLFEAGIFEDGNRHVQNVLDSPISTRHNFVISVSAHLNYDLGLTAQEVDEFAAFKAPQLSPPRIALLTEEVIP